MKAVIYARYSSERQSEDSISAQIRACEEYAQKKNIQIVGVYKDEAISGRETKTELRKDYQRMLRDMKKHFFELILIHKYDRVSRSLTGHVNLEDRLEKEGVRLIAVSQDFGISNEAKLTRSLMWSLSEYYIDNLANETRKGHRETALKGLHNGGVAPFGYDIVNQHYVVNDLEAAYVRKLFTCALERKGFTELIKEMNAEGIKGKRGAPIKYTQLYEMLRNEKYCGVYLYTQNEEKDRTDRRSKPNAIRIENAFPAIIDRATFEEVQTIMNGRKQTGRKAEYLCSGLVYCANCGAKMHVYKSTRKGHTYLYYRCSAACGASTVRVESVDTAVQKYFVVLLSDDVQKKVARILRSYKGHEKDRKKSFYDAIRKRIAEKEVAYNNLLSNMRAAVLPQKVLEDVSRNMAALLSEIEELKEATPPEDYSVDTITEWLQALRNSPDCKALHLFVERIEAKRIENKTDINITTTLMPVLEKMVAGEGFEPTTSGL